MLTIAFVERLGGRAGEGVVRRRRLRVRPALGGERLRRGDRGTRSPRTWLERRGMTVALRARDRADGGRRHRARPCSPNVWVAVWCRRRSAASATRPRSSATRCSSSAAHPTDASGPRLHADHGYELRGVSARDGDGRAARRRGRARAGCWGIAGGLGLVARCRPATRCSGASRQRPCRPAPTCCRDEPQTHASGRGRTWPSAVRACGDRRARARDHAGRERRPARLRPRPRPLPGDRHAPTRSGVTGPPGVGKSSLIGALLAPRPRARSGRSASSRSTRRARSRRARSSATGSGSPTTSSIPASSSARWARAATSAGSPRRRCRRCCILDAAGKDVVFLETVGTGPERGRGDRRSPTRSCSC